MKRIYTWVIVFAFTLPIRAQLPVTDLASIYQNVANFATDAYEQYKHTESLAKYIMLSEEALEKLQNVSNYVQQAKVSVEIIQEGVQLAKQVKNIQDEICGLQSLTDEEISNALCLSVELGEMIAEKIDQASEMAGKKVNKQGGELSDYERLQLLQNIKKEIKDLQEMLAKVQKRFQAKDAKEQVQQYTNDMVTCAILYGVSGGETALTLTELNKTREEMKKSTSKKSSTSSKTSTQKKSETQKK